MGSDHYIHPEFGWLVPAPRLRRELRVGFYSMLFGMSIGVVAVSALSVGSRDADTTSVSPVATRGVVAASVTTEASPNAAGNKRLEAASINTDRARTDNEVSTSDPIKPDTASTYLGNSGRKDARRAGRRGGVGWGSLQQMIDPAIASVPLGRAEPSTGSPSLAGVRALLTLPLQYRTDGPNIAGGIPPAFLNHRAPTA